MKCYLKQNEGSFECKSYETNFSIGKFNILRHSDSNILYSHKIFVLVIVYNIIIMKILKKIIFLVMFSNYIFQTEFLCHFRFKKYTLKNKSINHDITHDFTYNAIFFILTKPMVCSSRKFIGDVINLLNLANKKMIVRNVIKLFFIFNCYSKAFILFEKYNLCGYNF